MFPTLRKELHKYVPAKFDDYKLRYTTNEGAPGFFIPDFDIAGEYDAKRSNLDEDLYMHKINQHRRKKLIVLDDDEKDDDEKNITSYSTMMETYVLNPMKNARSEMKNEMRSEMKSEVKRNEMNKESYDSSKYIDEADYTYLQILQERAMCVCRFLLNNKYYHKYINNWKLLASNLDKNKLTFQRLQDSDEDVAYVINKGEEVNFRFRDKIRYIPINVYQYVLYHEMAHMSTHELQHTDNFYMLMSIIVLAGFELGFIDLKRIPNDVYMSNNQEILDRLTIKEEIKAGTHNIETPESKEHFEGLRNYIERIG